MSQITRFLLSIMFVALAQLALIPQCLAVPQGTAFTYQGRLDDNGQAASGNHDFEFRLFDMASGGSELALQSRSGVAVVDGVFSVQLDFGDLGGDQRWLQISVTGKNRPLAATYRSLPSTAKAVKLALSDSM